LTDSTTPKDLALAKAIAYFGHFHVYDVTQLLLGIVTDPDVGVLAILANPLVAAGIPAAGMYLDGHHVLL
jgi:hypothetical protein